MDPITIISQYGWAVGSMMVAVAAFYLDWIVTGARHRAMEADYKARLQAAEAKSAEWQQLALELGGVSRSALNIAERHVPRTGG